MSWQCFLAQPLDRARQTLRRYVSHTTPDRACPLVPGEFSYHNAETRIEDVAWTGESNGCGNNNWPHDDPRWPMHCACGYAFALEDEWQYNAKRLYIRPQGGDSFTLHDSPIGAMFFAPWLTEGLRRPSDAELQPGVHKGYLSRFYWQDWYGKREPLLIQCPGRAAHWIPDAVASNGEGWQVTGEVPLITARPSIGMPQYHGWLTNGVLSDDLEGRTFPS